MGERLTWNGVWKSVGSGAVPITEIGKTINNESFQGAGHAAGLTITGRLGKTSEHFAVVRFRYLNGGEREYV